MRNGGVFEVPAMPDEPNSRRVQVRDIRVGDIITTDNSTVTAIETLDNGNIVLTVANFWETYRVQFGPDDIEVIATVPTKPGLNVIIDA